MSSQRIIRKTLTLTAKFEPRLAGFIERPRSASASHRFGWYLLQKAKYRCWLKLSNPSSFLVSDIDDSGRKRSDYAVFVLDWDHDLYGKQILWTAATLFTAKVNLFDIKAVPIKKIFDPWALLIMAIVSRLHSSLIRSMVLGIANQVSKRTYFAWWPAAWTP